MTARQLDLSEYLKTETKTKSPSTMRAMTLQGLWYYLKISRDTWYRYKQDEGLSEVIHEAENVIYEQKFAGAAADLLAGEPERKDKRFNQFVHKVGRAIKPALLRIDRAERVEVVRDAAMIQGWFDDGLSCLDEIQEFFGVKV